MGLGGVITFWNGPLDGEQHAWPDEHPPLDVRAACPGHPLLKHLQDMANDILGPVQVTVTSMIEGRYTLCRSTLEGGPGQWAAKYRWHAPKNHVRRRNPFNGLPYWEPKQAITVATIHRDGSITVNPALDPDNTLPTHTFQR